MILFAWHWIMNTTFDKITKELTELYKSYTKLGSDLSITKAASESPRNQIDGTSVLEQWSVLQTENSGNIWNTRKY